MNEAMPLDLEWEMMQTILARAQETNPSYAEALWAAAVLHWFDEQVLAALLPPPQPSPASEGGAFSWLIARPFVERYYQAAPADSPPRYNLHERTRRVLLSHLKSDDLPRFRELSRRAAGFFQDRLSRIDPALLSSADIHVRAEPPDYKAAPHEWGLAAEYLFEWLYHWLAVDDEQAFGKLTDLYHRLEFQYNLAACGRLLALTQEQRDLLTGDRPQWLRYYQGRLLQYSQRWADALAVWEPLQHEELGPKLKSWLANHIGIVYRLQGRWDEALQHYQASLDIARALGDRQGEAQTLGNIGNVYASQGRWDEALAHYQASLDIFRALGDRHGESTTLMNIGNVYQSQGRWDEALAHYQASLDIFRALGDRHGEANVLGSLGILSRQTGRWDEAIPYYKQKLEICRQLGDRPGGSGVLNNLGVVYAKKGSWAEAIQCYEDSLKIEREMKDRLEEARTLGNLGDVFKETGEWAKAEDYYKQAITILRDFEDKEQLGDWLEALGELYRMRGMWAEAVQVHEQALPIWRELAQAQSGQVSDEPARANEQPGE